MTTEKSLAVRFTEAKNMEAKEYVDILNKKLGQYGIQGWKVQATDHFSSSRLLRIYDPKNGRFIHDFYAPIFIDEAHNFIMAMMIVADKFYMQGVREGRADNQKQIRAALGIKDENGEPEYYYNGPIA
jgi:hypothetical protein